MMTYLLKVIICSAFFLAIYYVLLEKIKMAHFNRFYLLTAMIASFVIPAITFVSEVTVFPAFAGSEELSLPITETVPLIVEEVNDTYISVSLILKCVYLFVTFTLLLRFTRNLHRLLSLAKQNKNISFPGHSFVLLKKETTPFSFFRFIFIYEKDYNSNKIEPEVIYHELSHIRQYHSVDVVLVELVTAFAWFNPVLFLYKRAIQLNHEFLADDAVVDRFHDPVAYQLLLLEKISKAGRNYGVASSFNYKITQKRLAMITNSLSTRYKVLRAFLLIPVAGAAVLLFSERSLAQVPAAPMEEIEAKGNVNISDTLPSKKQNNPPKTWGIFPESEFIGGTTNGASTAELAEYKHLIDEDRKADKNGDTWSFRPSEKNTPRMIEIFSKMSKAQQLQQEIIFVNPPKPMEKNVPTANQFENFQDASKYGIWIDNKRADNAALSNYKHTDFAQFSVSKLYGKAKEGRSYTHQLNLTTQTAFERENERRRQIKAPIALNRVKVEPRK